MYVNCADARASQSRISGFAGLHENACETVFTPGMVGFARMVGLNRERAAVKFSPLHCQVDLSTTLIAGNDGKFCAQSFFQQLGHVAA